MNGSSVQSSYLPYHVCYLPPDVLDDLPQPGGRRSRGHSVSATFGIRTILLDKIANVPSVRLTSFQRKTNSEWANNFSRISSLSGSADLNFDFAKYYFQQAGEKQSRVGLQKPGQILVENILFHHQCHYRYKLNTQNRNLFCRVN